MRMSKIKLFEDYTNSHKEESEIKQSLFDTIMDYYRDGILVKPVIEDKVLSWLYDQIIATCKELREYNIKSTDFLNTNNWGVKKDGNLAVFDIGFGDYYDEFNVMPRNLELSEEEGNTNLLKRILAKYDIKNSTLLGSGLFGHAHDIGNNKVLKITKDKTEAINSHKIIGKKPIHIAHIYSVDYFTLHEKTYYVIILEKLVISEKLTKDYVRLKKYFDDKRSKHLDLNIIEKIGKKHKEIGDFLSDLNTLGYSKGWEKWRELLHNDKSLTKDFDYNDYNDISEIIYWIKNSQWNNHSVDDEPPHHIQQWVEKLLK